MKRIWAAAALTLAMVILCSVFLHYTKKVTDDLNRRIDILSAAEEDDRQAESETKELLKVWEEYEKKLSLHMRHNDLEEVTLAFTRMESCWTLGEYEMFRMACEDARVAVEHLWEEEHLSLKNIF